MAKTVLSLTCPFCGSKAKETSRMTFGAELWIDLECGHTLVRDSIQSEEISIVSRDGRTPFPYQMDGAKFIEAADCNGLILDEQGLGKTVQECLLLARNKEQLLPALIVVKSGLRAQWMVEVFRWTGMVAQIIEKSTDKPFFDHFDIFIVSIDTLRLIRPDIKVVTEMDMAMAERAGRKIPKQPKALWGPDICSRFKHVCIDEIQKVKNPGASRTQALRKIVAEANGGRKARVIGLSGTPIDKHAGEYFVALNLVRPELFPSPSTYQITHCRVNPETGKIGGLKNPERFRELTQDFIIRRKRADVLPDLPKVFRQFRLADLEGGELEAYIRVVKEFKEYMEDDKPKIPTAILGFLSKMRHITGIAKVPAAFDFCVEFMEESERPLTVFLHHQQAAAELILRLEKWCIENDEPMPLYLRGGMTLKARVEVEEAFRQGKSRILVASTLASCEGLNLQFCQDCLFLERQWNPSSEEQAESRFPRPRPEDPWPVGAKIMAHYLIAAGTIDDFLTEIVEVKRSNVAQTLDGKEVEWDERSLQMELAKVLQTKGLAKWRIAA